MKKILIIAALSTLSLFNIVEAKTPKKVIIDLATLKTESKEGREFTKKRENIYKDLQQFEMNKRQEISEAQRTVTTDYQQGKINQKDAQEKIAALSSQQRRAEFEVQERRDAAVAQTQQLEQALEEKIVSRIPALAEKNGWADVREARTGGTLYVAKTLDKTDITLDAINKAFDADNLKSQLTKKA